MSLISKNVELKAPLRTSSWRKVAIGTWRTAGDPSVYGILEVDAGPTLAYLEKLRKETGIKITLSHIVGRAIAKMIEQTPEINCILRWGKLYPRDSIDIFFQVANDPSGKDLSGTVIRNANLKTTPQIAMELQNKVQAIRNQGDPSFKKMKKTMGFVPGFFSQPIINFIGFLMYGLNLWSPLFGSPKDAFGSVMLTNIGSLGLDTAFAPLVPYSRVPLLVALGNVKETPVVRNGQVQAAQTFKLCVTFDHRLIDGVHASKMSQWMNRIFSDPERELGDLANVGLVCEERTSAEKPWKEVSSTEGAQRA